MREPAHFCQFWGEAGIDKRPADGAPAYRPRSRRPQDPARQAARPATDPVHAACRTMHGRRTETVSGAQCAHVLSDITTITQQRYAKPSSRGGRGPRLQGCRRGPRPPRLGGLGGGGAGGNHAIGQRWCINMLVIPYKPPAAINPIVCKRCGRWLYQPRGQAPCRWCPIPTYTQRHLVLLQQWRARNARAAQKQLL